VREKIKKGSKSPEGIKRAGGQKTNKFLNIKEKKNKKRKTRTKAVSGEGARVSS